MAGRGGNLAAPKLTVEGSSSAEGLASRAAARMAAPLNGIIGKTMCLVASQGTPWG